MNVKEFLSKVQANNAHEPEFIQAVTEVVESLEDFLNQYPEYDAHCILERIVEPERSIIFRVPRIDDKGTIQINRGYRVQFNSAL